MSTSKFWFTFTIAALVAAIQADGSNKRVPSGFLGMRGKKSVDFSGLDDPYAYNMLDNTPVYLEPFDRNHDDMFYGYSDHFNSMKRAPKGFQGMRGKKNYLMDAGPTYDELFADDLDKRAMGFQGMRGKREYEYAPLAYLDKRGQIGFQGMRGKKSEVLSKEFMHAFDEHITEDPLKKEGENKDDKTLELEQTNGVDSGDVLMTTRQRRASNMGFFGVRGKKMPSSTSSFFGMRGKKGPYDYQFRGKFVGVRGKKMYQGEPGEIQYYTGGMPWDSDGFEKRKGPSGFMGMRGKKWVNSEMELSQAENANNGNGEE